MALDPERELTNIWTYWVEDAKAAHGRTDINGFFSDARNRDDNDDRCGRNSIMDAEALLCFLQPQSTINSFSVRDGLLSEGVGVNVINSIIVPSGEDRPEKLEKAAIEIVLDLALDFLETNQVDDAPDFSGRTYFDLTPDTPKALRNRSVSVVDSFSMSVSVCLQLLYLCGLNGWGNMKNTNEKIANRCEQVQSLANSRLTAALAGLCQSFAYTEMESEDWRANTGIPWNKRDEEFTTIQNRLAGLGIEVDKTKAFECGWSWGIHDKETRRPDELKALPDKLKATAHHSDGVPLASPYLYFTISTIDGIDDLFAPWVQIEELLDPIQLALTARLRNLTDLTSRYWAALAFGDSQSSSGRWALESIPWRTADGNASLQWSLYVYGLALREHLDHRRATTSYELERLIGLLEEFAQLGRLTRPPIDNPSPHTIQSKLTATKSKLTSIQSKLKDSDVLTDEDLLTDADLLTDSDLRQIRRDPALSLHWPGVSLNLQNSMEKSIFEYKIYDFAPQLAKRAALLLANTSELQFRERLRRLIDSVWDGHLGCRSNREGIGEKFWDFPNKAYASLKKDADTVVSLDDDAEKKYKYRDGTRVSSWYITQRVIEAIVALAHDSDHRQQSRLPTIEPFVRELLHHLINDIDHRLYASGPSDRDRLEDLRTEAMSINEDQRSGDVTATLRNLFAIIPKVK